MVLLNVSIRPFHLSAEQLRAASSCVEEVQDEVPIEAVEGRELSEGSLDAAFDEAPRRRTACSPRTRSITLNQRESLRVSRGQHAVQLFGAGKRS